jgi:hypothetical protein
LCEKRYTLFDLVQEKLLDSSKLTVLGDLTPRRSGLEKWRDRADQAMITKCEMGKAGGFARSLLTFLDVGWSAAGLPGKEGLT